MKINLVRDPRPEIIGVEVDRLIAEDGGDVGDRDVLEALVDRLAPTGWRESDDVGPWPKDVRVYREGREVSFRDLAAVISERIEVRPA